jgi:hypothetical protein
MFAMFFVLVHSYYGNTGDERLKQIVNLSTSGSVLSQFNYGFNPAGEITNWVQQNSSMSPVNFACQYDKAGQLKGMNGSFGGSTLASRFNFVYDPSANRTAAQRVKVEPVHLVRDGHFGRYPDSDYFRHLGFQVAASLSLIPCNQAIRLRPSQARWQPPSPPTAALRR